MMICFSFLSLILFMIILFNIITIALMVENLHVFINIQKEKYKHILLNENIFYK
jgi:hypothetical protein